MLSIVFRSGKYGGKSVTLIYALYKQQEIYDFTEHDDYPLIS